MNQWRNTKTINFNVKSGSKKNININIETKQMYQTFLYMNDGLQKQIQTQNINSIIDQCFIFIYRKLDCSFSNLLKLIFHQNIGFMHI